MRSPSPVPLLVLLLLAGSSSVRAQPHSCETTARRVELAAGAAPPVEVCVSPGLSTTLLFDSAISPEGVVLEGRNLFQRVEVGDRLLVLVPSARLEPGKRLRLEVRFARGEVPTSVTFTLVAHPSQAERQVELVRAGRLAESCQEELRRKEAELAQCQQQLARPFSEAPASLGRLIVGGLLDKDSLKTALLTKEALVQPPGEAVRVLQATLFRSTSRLVLHLRLKSADARTAWAFEGGELLGASGEAGQALWFRQAAALPPGVSGDLWVELEIPTRSAREPQTLKLWDAGKARTITLRNLKLP
jgi:uncharacterized protein (TIGR02268 family)